MAAHLNVSIVTPEGTAFEGPARQVVVPGHDGEVAFLPRHAPYVGLLGVGEVRLDAPAGGTTRWFLSGGVVQVVDDVVSVLAESVQTVATLDAAKAQVDLDAALAVKATDAVSAAARDKAQAIARAKVRLSAKRR